MTEMEFKTAVAHHYGELAVHPEDVMATPVGRKFAESIGYSHKLLSQLPESLYESFTGAGNPHPYLKISKGETIVDLGCGAGLDLYLYAKATGPKGKVYGVDISVEMLNKAEENMHALGVKNCKFHWEAADSLTIKSESVDCITTNGILNYCPDKDAVVKEMHRVLKSGGCGVIVETVMNNKALKDAGVSSLNCFKELGGIMTEKCLLKKFQTNGFKNAEILWKGSNAAVGHHLEECIIIKVQKEKGDSFFKS